MDEALDLELLGANILPVRRRMHRTDPFVLSDVEFKKHYRFSKEGVRHLVQLFNLQKDNRGAPLSPEQKMCIALNTYAGANFQRVSGLIGGVSQSSARSALLEVTDALCGLKEEYINMPLEHEMRETSLNMLNRFHLPNFAFAVDGVQIFFDGQPRGVPPHQNRQSYWSRKQSYAINVQAVCGDGVFYDIDVAWPGGTHDARIWNTSQAKLFIENLNSYYVAGDSGYPISTTLVKPYSVAEATRDPSKALFNRRLSGIRYFIFNVCYYLSKES